MQVNELIGYDKIRGRDKIRGNTLGNLNDRKFTLVQRLVELGFHELGRGTFATVFTHPSKSYVIKIFQNDPCYLKFVQTALRHQDNPHFPKFIGKPLALPTDKQIFGIRMERLDLLTPSENRKLNNMRDALQYGRIGVTLDPLLLDALDIIRNDDEKECGGDLTSQNVMMRGDTLVIIDPYYSRIAARDTY